MSKIKQAKLFSLIADKVIEVSNKEQLSICLRHVDVVVHEVFTDFAEVQTIIGANLESTITQRLADRGYPFQSLEVNAMMAAQICQQLGVDVEP